MAQGGPLLDQIRLQAMSAGKGSKPRPYNPQTYADNHERIFKKHDTEIKYSNSDNSRKGKATRRAASKSSGSSV